MLSAENLGDTQPGTGPIGLLLIALLAVATILLIRNMNARLRRLPERFPAPPAAPPEASTEPAPAAGDEPTDHDK